MKAYGAIVDGRAPAHVRPWLFRIAHNAALDLVARRREVPTPSVGDRAAAPQHDPLAGVLVTAVAALPERQRHVFVLRELHGLRIDETAAELGLSAPQVEQALFAARNRLSEQLTFGGRLDCVSVRRLGRESLDVRERRALTKHACAPSPRCPDCRSAAGAGGGAFGFTPRVPLEWLRELIGLGGMPAMAKIGVAAVAAATMGSGAASPASSTALHGGPVARPAASGRAAQSALTGLREVQVPGQSRRARPVRASPRAARAFPSRSTSDNAPHAQHGGDQGRSTQRRKR